MTDPRPVHRHVWNGGVLPAWLDSHHHDDHGRLVIHTPDGEARPEAGWWLIGWSSGTVTAASPWTGRHVYGPDGIAAQLERAEAALSRVAALADQYPADIDTALIHEALDTPARGHTYLSTGCLHGDHAYCQNTTGRAGAKRPGECKHCGAKCICGCHTPAEQSARTTPNNPPTSKETP